jgi:hypothetical protein
LPISRRYLIQTGKSGRGKVTNSDKVKEPRKTKTAARKKAVPAAIPAQVELPPEIEVKQKAAAPKKPAVKKEAPKKPAAKKAAQDPLLAELESLRRENEDLKSKLAEASARADRLQGVTTDVVKRLDSVITLIRGLVES